MQNPKEIFINGVLSTYLIYEDGTCYNKKTNRYLKPRQGKYFRYSLSLNGKVSDHYIHRLVGQYYLINNNPLEKIEINHKDGDRYNNHYLNLEWVSKKENLKHQKENYLYGDRMVFQYDLFGNFIASYRTASEVEDKLGFNQKQINTCCLGIIKNSFGFQWCFKEDIKEIKINGLNNYLLNQSILMYDKQGNFIKEFKNPTEAYKFFGKRDNGIISQVLKGRRKSTWGYVFKYKNL